MSGDEVSGRSLTRAGLVLWVATLGGCGFLDDSWHLSHEAFEESFETERARGRLSGTGRAGGGSASIAIGCGGVRGDVGYGYGRSSLPDLRKMRRWHRRYCSGGGSAMCRQLRRELVGTRSSSNVVLAYVEGDEEDEEDDEQD